MKSRVLFLLAIVVVSILVYAFSIKSDTQNSFLPKEGAVPDEETAIKIAEAVWLPIYGKDVLNKKPYHAKLKNDSIWVVEGTLPEGMRGGVPHIEINKRDCKVFHIIHTQ